MLRACNSSESMTDQVHIEERRSIHLQTDASFSGCFNTISYQTTMEIYMNERKRIKKPDPFVCAIYICSQLSQSLPSSIKVERFCLHREKTSQFDLMKRNKTANLRDNLKENKFSRVIRTQQN